MKLCVPCRRGEHRRCRGEVLEVVPVERRREFSTTLTDVVPVTCACLECTAPVPLPLEELGRR